MLIALDYDETYTRDPLLWNKFLALAVSSGHRVVCLTMRYPEEAVTLPCEVVYTSRKAKKRYAESLLLHVDIWIDDAPHFILVDSMEARPGDEPAGTDALSAMTGKSSFGTMPQRILRKFLAFCR